MLRTFVLSNVTLGYGSPQYIYFLRELEKAGIETVSIEPFEYLRPRYRIPRLSCKRLIIGEWLFGSILKRFKDSYKFSKYMLLPARSMLLRLHVVKLAVVSYFRPMIVMTTEDHALFSWFSKKTILVQNFTEIWDRGAGDWGAIQRYRANVKICLSPQEDRLVIAKERYPNAQHFLVHNAPPRATSSSNKCVKRKRVLYQGRLGERNYPDEIIAFTKALSEDVELHIAGLIEEPFCKQLESLAFEQCNVKLHGYVNAEELKSLRERCNIGLVAWDNETENTRFAAPNKLYEHIQNGDLVLMFPNLSLDKMNAQWHFGRSFKEGASMARFVNQLSTDSLEAYQLKNRLLHESELNFETQIATALTALNKLAR